MSTGFSSAAIPNAPTIGAATATSDVAATVAYTAAVLGANGVTFTATSNPSSITGTGSSPITVTGLTASTSYTFTVTAGNANGTSAASSASNSITTSATLESFESIATVTVSSATQPITFSSIPSNFKHLQVRIMSRDARGTIVNNLLMQINGDTTANYTYHSLIGNASTVTADGAGYVSGATDYIYEPGASTTASVFGASIFDILDYTNTNKKKTIRMLGGFDDNGTGRINFSSSHWNSTDAITSLTFKNSGNTNFVQYSSFALYGIKG
jgi:hypothetical protein